MAAFLETLAARAQGQAPLLAVRGRARFEPRADTGGSTGSDLSDPPDRSDLGARAVGSPAERLAPGPQRPAQRELTVEPVLLEQPGSQQSSSERRDTRSGSIDRAATGVPPDERAGTDPALLEPTPPTPGGAPVAEPPDRRPPPNSGEPIDRQQANSEADASIRTQVPGGRDHRDHPDHPDHPDHTVAPEPVAPQGLQPDSLPPRPSAGRARRPTGASSTQPDPVRTARRGRQEGSVPPPQQLLTEHVVPALIRAGLVSPDGADDVRLPPTWAPDDVRETIGAAGVPEVHVHIGRVEVNQAPTPSQPTPAPTLPARVRPRLPAVDHDAYLARRRQSDRGAR